MIDLLIGRDCFKKALTLFFTKFDLQAVTSEDLLNCVQEIAGNRYDISQFITWYEQEGTPVITVEHSVNQKTVNIRIKQTLCNPKFSPQPIPLSVGIFNESGVLEKEQILFLANKFEETWDFYSEDFHVFSVNRGFGAPVIIEYLQQTEKTSFSCSNLRLMLFLWFRML
jgi:aminopeptidase N